MPRSRQSINRGLPRNLYRNPLRWRNPVTGKVKRLGRLSEDDAISYALRENDKLRMPGRVSGSSLAKLWPQYVEYMASSGRYSAATIAGRERHLRGIARKLDAHGKPLGMAEIEDFDRLILVKLWGTNGVAQKRVHWMKFLDWCIAQGHADINEARLTLKPLAKPKQRKQLTVESYNASLALADPWLARTMEIALCTGLRASDLMALTYRDHMKDDRIEIVPQKTGNASKRMGRTAIAASIPITPRLAKALKPTMRFARFVIHKPGRHQQLQVKYVSSQWRKINDCAWHEIRGLSGRLYTEALIERGLTLEEATKQAQARYSHSSAQTTAGYLMDDVLARFESVEAGL